MVYKPIFNFYPEKRKAQHEVIDGFRRYTMWVNQEHIDAIKSRAYDDEVSVKDLIYAIFEKEISTWKPKN